jgi:hypothetical protein
MRTGNIEDIGHRVRFDHDVSVELWDSDRREVPHRKDDHFGTVRLDEREVRGTIRAGGHLSTHTFRPDRGIVGDASYTLTYNLHQV